MRRLGAAQSASEQAGGVGDVVVRVGADDETIELFAYHTGQAGVRLGMEYESNVRDEGLVAAAARTTHVGRLMHPQVEVMAEVGLALEGPLAVGAVGFHVANGCLGLC